MKSYCGECVDNDLWDWFASRFYYIAGDFNDQSTLRQTEGITRESWTRNTRLTGNYFFYLATAPDFFGPIRRKTGRQRA